MGASSAIHRLIRNPTLALHDGIIVNSYYRITRACLGMKFASKQLETFSLKMNDFLVSVSTHVLACSTRCMKDDSHAYILTARIPEMIEFIKLTRSSATREILDRKLTHNLPATP